MTCLYELGLYQRLITQPVPLQRFCVLIKIQERLVQHDVNETLIPRSSRTNNTEGNSSLTEALLEDNEAASVATGGGGDGGSTTVERDTTGTPNWWEKSSEVAQTVKNQYLYACVNSCYVLIKVDRNYVILICSERVTCSSC